MDNDDHDLRYMAVADLKETLSTPNFRGIPRDAKRVIDATVARLSDSSRDVRAVVVDTFPLLVAGYGRPGADALVPPLGNNLFADAEELRDVSSLGLSVLLRADLDVADAITSLAIPPVVRALGEDDPKINIRGLEVAQALLENHAAKVAHAHADLLPVLLSLLAASRESVRKAAVACLGFLASDLDAPLFESLLDQLLESITNADSAGTRKTGVACLTAVVQIGGSRVAHRLDAILPLVKSILIDPVGREHDMDDVEVSETVLQLYAALVTRTPAAITSALDDIIATNLAFLSFDPNYQDDDDDDDNESGDDEAASDEDPGSDSGSEYGDYSDYDDEDMSDDEDVSWKVRKAAAKGLAAIVATRPSMIPAFYSGPLVSTLVKRFKERQEAVKADVFDTFVTLLKTTAAVSATDLLLTRLPAVAKALKTPLSKSTRARDGAVRIVASLASILPGGLSSILPTLVPKLVKIVADDDPSASSTRLAVCGVLSTLLSSHPTEVIGAAGARIARASTPLTSHANFKIIEGGLSVLSAAAPALGANSDTDEIQAGLSSVFAVLDGGNSDRHVKVAALTSLGALVSAGASVVGPDAIAPALPHLVAGTQNAIMDVKTAAVSALAAILASPSALQGLDFSSVAPTLLPELAGFLRKADRDLVLVTLKALEGLLENAPSVLDADAVAAIQANSVPLISTADLVVTANTLQLGVGLLRAFPATADAVASDALGPIQALLVSAVLQGAALDGVCAILVALGQVSSSSSPAALVDTLVALASDDLPRQAYTSIASAIGGLVAVSESPESYLETFAASATSAPSEGAQVLALYALGSVGAVLSTADASSSLAEGVMNTFGVESERVKVAGAYALGLLTCGAPDSYVPLILNKINGVDLGNQYLLNLALKEFISQATPESIAPHADALWEVFVQFADSEEVGTRNVATESLGLLTALDPASRVPLLAAQSGQASPLLRANAVSALRTAVMKDADGLGPELESTLATFLGLAGDDDLEVRRAAVNTLTFLVQTAPSLVRDLVPELLPLLYAELPTKPELIRELTLGVVTIKVDDGEKNRKIALEAFRALVANALDKLDIHTLLPLIMEGMMEKKYPNKMLCHAIIIQLAHVVPSTVVEALPDLSSALASTLKTRPNTKTAKDLEALESLIKSALKLVLALDALDADFTLPAVWKEFVAGVGEGKYADLFVEMKAAQQ